MMLCYVVAMEFVMMGDVETLRRSTVLVELEPEELEELEPAAAWDGDEGWRGE